MKLVSLCHNQGVCRITLLPRGSARSSLVAFSSFWWWLALPGLWSHHSNFCLCDHTAYSSSLSDILAAAKSLQSCSTLCDPIDSSPPRSSVPGILQARILERVAISFSNACMHAKSLQSCSTLCDPIDGSPPGSPIAGILQARIWFPTKKQWH